MTIRWIYPNFDFEYELARPIGYQPSRFFVEFATRWGSALRLLPGCSEARVLPLDAADRDPTDCLCGARDHTPQGVAAPLTPYGRSEQMFSKPPLRRLDLHEGGFFEGLRQSCPAHGRDVWSAVQEGDRCSAVQEAISAWRGEGRRVFCGWSRCFRRVWSARRNLISVW